MTSNQGVTIKRSRDLADKSHLILAKDKKANFHAQLTVTNLPEMSKANSVHPHEANQRSH